ncbi:MAG: hypothetical protein U5L95_02410 [Candidatus Saccharibacteria bacterium]|nr:hypothetical protein [Candidatus Saccharibacteria bacterium]
MSNSVADILGNREFHEPKEIQIIKSFVRKEFGVDCLVKMNDRGITIIVDSAALAGTLRMHLHTLKEMCQTKKRLFIRIV